jgi:hypothetical protein
MALTFQNVLHSCSRHRLQNRVWRKGCKPVHHGGQARRDDRDGGRPEHRRQCQGHAREFQTMNSQCPSLIFTHLWATQVGALGTDAIAKDTRENFRQFGVKTQFLAEKEVFRV